MLILVRAIGWVVVTAFAITLLITILGLIHKVQVAEPYLNRLFAVLIAELVPAGFFLFQFGIKEEASSKTLGELKRGIARLLAASPEDVTLEYIQRRLISPPRRESWDYTATIYWHPEYAEKLFNHEGGTPDFRPINPHSEGHVHYYRTQTGNFKGFSLWTAKNGEQSFSKLAVTLSEFEFDGSGYLQTMCLTVAFRKMLREFSYAPFTHYRMRFADCSETQLRGKMLLLQNGNGEKEIEAGDVVMELN